MIYEALICFLMKHQHFKMLPIVSFRKLFQGRFCSHFNFYIYDALCSHVVYVYYIVYVYALFLYLMLLRLSFMSIKICSVPLTELLAFNI